MLLSTSRRGAAQCAGGARRETSGWRTPLARPAPRAAAAAGAADGQGGDPSSSSSTADTTTTPLVRSTRAPRRKSTDQSSAQQQQQPPRGSAASAQKRRAAEEAQRFAAAAASADPALAALRGRLVRRAPQSLGRSGEPAAALDVGVLGGGKERYYAIAVVEGKEERYASWLLKRAKSGVAPGGLPVAPAPSIAEVWCPKRSARVYVPATDSLSKTPKVVPYGGGGWVFVRCAMDTAAANAIAQTPNFAAFRGAQSWDSALLRASGALDYYASAADEKAGKLSPPPNDLRVEGQAGAAKGAVVLPEPSSDALVAAVKAWEAEADPSRGGALLEEAVEARRREVYGDAGGTVFGVTAEEGRAAAEAQKREAAAAARGGGAAASGRGGRAGGRGGRDGGSGGRDGGRGARAPRRQDAQGYDDGGGGGGGRWSSSSSPPSPYGGGVGGDECGDGDDQGAFYDRRVRTPPGDRRGDAERRRPLGDGARYDPYALDRDMGSDRYGGGDEEGFGGGGFGGSGFGGGEGAAARRDETAYFGGGGGQGGGQGGGDLVGDALYMGDELFASDSRAGRYADDDGGGGPAAVPTPPGDRGASRRRALGDGARFDPYSLDRDTASDRYSSDDDDGGGGGGYYDARSPQPPPPPRMQQPRQQQERAAAGGRGRAAADPIGDTLFGGSAHAEDGGRYYDGGQDYDGGEDPNPPRARGGAWYGDGSGDEEERGAGAAAPEQQRQQRQPSPSRGGNIGSDALGDALFGLDYVEGGYRGVDLED